MFAALFFATTPLLNLEVGQAYEIVGQLDCEVDAGTIDLHGAASTSSIGNGKKRVSLLFSTQWPADWSEGKKSKIGLLAFETQGEATTLSEIDYNYDYVPVDSTEPQPTIVLQSGVTFYVLSPRDGSNKWNYEENQVLAHGATQTFKGICEVSKKGK